jgi:hypothetical protein
MNIIYYVLGAAFTFIGQVIYRYFAGGSVLVLDQAAVFQLLIISSIAGISFFIADYIMHKVSK